MTYFNNLGQGRIGWRSPSGGVTPSTLWTSVYAVYNADSTGSSSLKTSLFAAYNGESNSNDSFGTNHGTAQGGLTYTAGKIGNGFNLNGSNAYVSLPDNSLNFTEDFSFSFWIYNYNMPLGVNRRYIGSSYYGGSGTYGFGWTLLRGSDNVYRFQLFNGDSNPNSLFSSNMDLIPINQWTHITVTRKKSTQTKIYKNGVDVTSNFSYTLGNSAVNCGYNSTQYCTIGALKDNNASIFGYINGTMDAVNVWNKELTQSEITELYNSGNGAQYITNDFYKPTTNDALNTYNGTAQGGLTYGVGKVGTAFQFNGSNAYVNMGDVMDIGTSSWSYSYWFNSPNAFPNQMVFSKALAGSSIGRVWSSVENNRVSFNFQADSSNIITTQMAASNIANNTWYHVVLVLDRTDKLKMYINGALYPITVFTGTNNLTPYTSTNYNTTHPFRIGAYTSGDNTTPIAFFNGQIDAFNAWNRVLTQSEITELYNAGNGKQYPN